MYASRVTSKTSEQAFGYIRTAESGIYGRFLYFSIVKHANPINCCSKPHKSSELLVSPLAGRDEKRGRLLYKVSLDCFVFPTAISDFKPLWRVLVLLNLIDK